MSVRQDDYRQCFSAIDHSRTPTVLTQALLLFHPPITNVCRSPGKTRGRFSSTYSLQPRPTGYADSGPCSIPFFVSTVLFSHQVAAPRLPRHRCLLRPLRHSPQEERAGIRLMGKARQSPVRSMKWQEIALTCDDVVAIP